MTNDCEQILAKEFHQYLNENGVEKNLNKTGILLHQLGLVYKNKSPDKLSLLKSAVLLNGAKLRKPENLEDITNDLQLLCKHILELADVENKDADLILASTDVKPKINKMREVAKIDVKQSLKLPEIKNDCDSKVKKDLLVCKIDHIQGIQNKITSDFIEIMDILATFTRKTLGDPPCRYALVGMGSLARKEITPYSDFEQMIILEEGVQERDDYENILEYFRWFAVIFLVTLINLGEMIIPFADIKSFQNLKPKFRDQVAKVGICPDGFNLSAGKNAICGSIELIKTPSEMSKCLSHDFLQNRFSDLISEKTAHFVNVLCKTRFVSGDREVHHELFEKSHQVFVDNYDLHMKLLQATIDKEYLNFNVMQKLHNYALNNKIDIKRLVYRTSTLYIVAMGKRYKCKAASCSEILSELKESGLLTEESQINLKYIIALACEVRLKIYMGKEEQQDNVNDVNEGNVEKLKLIEAIGLQSAIDYFSITASLQESARIMVDDNKEPFKMHQEIKFWAASMLTDFVTAIGYLDRIHGSPSKLPQSQPDMPELFQRNNIFHNLIQPNELAASYPNLLKTGEKYIKLAKKGNFLESLNLEMLSKVVKATMKQLQIESSNKTEVASIPSITPGNKVLSSSNQQQLFEDNAIQISKTLGKNVNLGKPKKQSNKQPDEEQKKKGKNDHNPNSENYEKQKIRENFMKRSKFLINHMQSMNVNDFIQHDPSATIHQMWNNASPDGKERVKTEVQERQAFVAKANIILDQEAIKLVRKLDDLGMRPIVEEAFKSNSMPSAKPLNMKEFLKFFNLPNVEDLEEILEGLEKRDLSDITLEGLVQVIGDESMQVGFRRGTKLLEIFCEQISDNVAELGHQFASAQDSSQSTNVTTPHCSKYKNKSFEKDINTFNNASTNSNKPNLSSVNNLSKKDKLLFRDLMKSVIHFNDPEVLLGQNNNKCSQPGVQFAYALAPLSSVNLNKPHCSQTVKKTVKEDTKDRKRCKRNEATLFALRNFFKKDKLLFQDFMKSFIVSKKLEYEDDLD